MSTVGTTSALGWDNKFTTTLSSGISASDTTIPLTNLPNSSQGFLVIEPDSSTAWEEIFYTSKTGSAVICPSVANGRGAGGSSAASHSAGATVRMDSTAEMFEALQDGTALAPGAVGFQNLSNPYKFSAYNSSTTTIAASFSPTKIAFQTEEYDTGNNYDNATNFRFVAPVAGFYQFYAIIQSNSGGTGDYWLLQLYKNGVAYKSGQNAIGSGTGLIAPSVSPPPMLLAVNDYIEVFCSQNGGATHTTTTGAASTYFGGYLLSAT